MKRIIPFTVLMLALVQSSYCQVIVNELMYAPLTGEAEWVELWNLSNEAVSLRNWTVNDATGNRVLLTSDEQLIEAHGFIVLASAAPLAARWPVAPSPVLIIAGFPALNNGGDLVVLRDANGVLIDSINYDGAWNSVRGSALERMHPLLGFGRDNCAASAHADAGTPGARNSRTPPDIDCAVTALISTDTGFTIRIANRGLTRATVASCLLLADRDRNGSISSGELFVRLPFTPPAVLDSLELTADFSDALSLEFRAILELAGDGLAANDTAVARRMPLVQPGDFVVNEVMAAPPADSPEWVEFLNLSDRPLFPGGLRLAGPPVLKGSREIIHLPAELPAVPPGGYLLVAADSTVYRLWPGLSSAADAVVCIVQRSSLGLSNESDAIYLLRSDDVCIDSVAYSSTWHHPLLPSGDGRSLELLQPALRGLGARAWTSCAHPSGGTPGARNSAWSDAPTDDAALTLSPNPFSPDGDGFEDHCVISWQLPSSVSLLRLRIYDMSGRCIRTLENVVPSGQRGMSVWDGLDSHGRRARIGPYVVLVQALDAMSNDVAATRAVLVVATRL
ncbi:MAG TPA: lamin tail domain-containing protein [Bacteroidota bacterium]|nr:lamin tail domain-containing protein [Bacteroidota bacterium]